MILPIPALRIITGLLALSVILDGIIFERDLVHLVVLHSLFLLLLALFIFVLVLYSQRNTPCQQHLSAFKKCARVKKC